MTAKIRLLSLAESVTVRLAHYTDRLDTFVQIKAGAARYAAGSGRKPTKAETQVAAPLADWERELICLICGSSCCSLDHEIPF